jgi:hypothetical protein
VIVAQTLMRLGLLSGALATLAFLVECAIHW